MKLREFISRCSGPIEVVRNREFLWASCPASGIVVVE